MYQSSKTNRNAADYGSAMEQKPFQKQVCAKNQTSSGNLTRLKFALFAALCLFYAHASYAKDIETLYPRNVTATSAICGGKMSANSTVGQILEKGICYMRKGEMEKNLLNRNVNKIVHEGSSEQEFTGLMMTGLRKNTTYQVRAYIIGADGSSYGDIREFITLERDDAPTGIGIGEPTAITDPGVVINGVRWATRNVDAPGTFAAIPESPGMLYKWDSKKAWPSTGLIENWDTGYSKSDKWQTKNDPCPTGWRLPYMTEIDKLNTKKSHVINGKLMGVFFGDASKQIFLPYVQTRQQTDGSLVWPLISLPGGKNEPCIYLPIADDVYRNTLYFRFIERELRLDWGISQLNRVTAYPCRCVKE